MYLLTTMARFHIPLFVGLTGAAALDNGLGALPAMG